MILARDQYGNEILLTSEHPRKELMDKLDSSHADRLYRNKVDGRTVHVGYVIRHHWYTFYTLTPWEQKA